MSEFDFENDVAINLDDLHEEWRTHAQARYQYAKEVAYCDKIVKKAHEYVKVTRSKLIKEAKELKLSSADLREAHYRDHKDYIAARDAQIDAEYELGMAWNALQAFDDRKIALENEVKLWTRNYFSSPTEERQIQPDKSIAIEGKDKATQKARSGMNKRRSRK